MRHLDFLFQQEMQKKIYLEFQKKFGENLKKLREKKKLSLREVAYNCELDDSNISKIEHGKSNITLKTVIELSKGLEVSLKSLFDFDWEW